MQQVGRVSGHRLQVMMQRAGRSPLNSSDRLNGDALRARIAQLYFEGWEMEWLVCLLCCVARSLRAVRTIAVLWKFSRMSSFIHAALRHNSQFLGVIWSTSEVQAMLGRSGSVR